MVPVSLFDIDLPQPLVLDMAASPGGKTTHLIDRTGDKGFILANDGSKGRISALRAVLSNWGGANIAITNYPANPSGPGSLKPSTGFCWMRPAAWKTCVQLKTVPCEKRRWMNACGCTIASWIC